MGSGALVKCRNQRYLPKGTVTVAELRRGGRTQGVPDGTPRPLWPSHPYGKQGGGCRRFQGGWRPLGCRPPVVGLLHPPRSHNRANEPGEGGRPALAGGSALLLNAAAQRLDGGVRQPPLPARQLVPPPPPCPPPPPSHRPSRHAGAPPPRQTPPSRQQWQRGRTGARAPFKMARPRPPRRRWRPRPPPPQSWPAAGRPPGWPPRRRQRRYKTRRVPEAPARQAGTPPQ